MEVKENIQNQSFDPDSLPSFLQGMYERHLAHRDWLIDYARNTSNVSEDRLDTLRTAHTLFIQENILWVQKTHYGTETFEQNEPRRAGRAF